MNNDSVKDLWTHMQAAKNQEEREQILLDFTLNELSPQLRVAIIAAAVPHFFGSDFLAALLEKPVDSGLFNQLTSLSFVEEYPIKGLYNVHERTRALLLDRFWKESRKKYQEYSRKAAEYYNTEDQDDTDRRIETIYHHLIGTPKKGAVELIKIGWNWQNAPNFSFDKLEAMAMAAREHLEAGRLEQLAVNWILFWEARIATRYSRFKEAQEKLLQMSCDRDQDPYTTANYLRSLGDVHLRLSEGQEARGCYEEALSICMKIGDHLGRANCLKSLGNVYLGLSEAQEARACYKEALPLYASIGDQLGCANCFRSLGDVHLRLSEEQEARECYEEALLLYEKIGSLLGRANCLKSLGDVHLCQSEAQEAHACYEEALLLFKKIGDHLGRANCLKSYGDLYVKTGGYKEASKRYDLAEELFKSIKNREGVAECQEGRAKLFEALQDLGQALIAWEDAATHYTKLQMPKRAAACEESLAKLRSKLN